MVNLLKSVKNIVLGYIMCNQVLTVHVVFFSVWT